MTNITAEEFDRLAEEGAELDEYFEDSTPVWQSCGKSTFEVTISNELMRTLSDQALLRNLSVENIVVGVLTNWCLAHERDQTGDGPTAA